MTEQAPATPANTAAAPGANSNGNNPPSNSAPNNGQNSGGTVTLTTKEFAQLNRDAARGRSAAKRGALGGVRTPTPASTGDVNADTLIKESMSRAEAAEARAFQMEVKDNVREILAKPEYKNIPEATKKLILKNPAAFSTAETLDEAILDIEEHLNEVLVDVAGEGNGGTQPAPAAAPAAQPAGHETPPKVGGSNPAPVTGNDLEDTSKLRGPARSQAAIRNAIKTAKKGAAA